MSTRTRKARRPRRQPAKPKPTVDLRHPRRPRTDLPTRTPARGHSDIPGPELLACRAALHATSIGIRVPVRAWHPTHNGARLDYPNGNHLLHDPTQTVHFTAYTLCPHGAHHAHPITGPADLARAVQEAAACRAHHAPDDFQWPDMVRLTPPVHTLAALDDDEDDTPDTAPPAPAEPAEPAEMPTLPATEETTTSATDDTDPDRTHEIDVRELRADHDTSRNHPDDTDTEEKPS